MNKLALSGITLFGVTIVGVIAACGSDNAESPDARVVRRDAAGDGGGGGTCDILAQTGCAAGEKCAWVRVSVSQAQQIGQMACVPAGAQALDAECAYGAMGATTGYDNCQAGLVCLANSRADMATGRCREICDVMGTNTAAACPTGFACGAYASFFQNSGATAPPPAGVCDPTCDPLDQTRDFDNAVACASEVPATPNRGCYGLPSQTALPSKFTCTGAGALTNVHRTEITPPVFLNVCAPGFVPNILEEEGLATRVCISYCDPENTWVGQIADAGGNQATNGACQQRGAVSANEECHFFWWLEGAQTPVTPPSDAVGMCLDFTRFRWDNDQMMGTPEVEWPSCKTLQRVSATPARPVDAAFAWGCSDSTTIPQAPAQLDVTPRGPSLGELGVRITPVTESSL